MKNASWIFAIVLTTSSHLIWAQGQDEAFQGLKWGDSLNTIQQRFPSARIQRLASCKGETMLDLPARPSCMAAKFSGYRVAGVDFEVTFYLSAPDQKLVEVGLWNMETGSASPYDLSKCKQIEALLSERYGAAYVTVNDKKGEEFITRSVHWLQSGGATNVQLSCFNGRTGASMSVGYAPKISPASGKL